MTNAGRFRMFVALMVVAMALAAAGCSGDDSSPTSPTPAPAPTPTPTPAPIDRMLGVVRQVRLAVFHFRDLRVTPCPNRAKTVGVLIPEAAARRYSAWISAGGRQALLDPREHRPVRLRRSVIRGRLLQTHASRVAGSSAPCESPHATRCRAPRCLRSMRPGARLGRPNTGA